MKKWKAAIIFFIIAGLLIFNIESFLPDLSGEGIPKISAFIPNKDRKRLEYFFRKLIFWEDVGYVLMGSKPCSITVFKDSIDFSLMLPSNLRFWLGWKTWKKYEKYFPHPSFSIFKENKKNGDSLLAIINNVEFKKTLEVYRNDFESVLQKPIDPDKMLCDAEFEPLFSKTLQNNEFLIGIVLGFGKKNSWLFHSNHRNQMVPFNNAEESELFFKYCAAKGVWGFASGSLFMDIFKLQLPGFIVDKNGSETAELRKKYSEDRQKIIEYFNRKNFLDAALGLLMQQE